MGINSHLLVQRRGDSSLANRAIVVAIQVLHATFRTGVTENLGLELAKGPKRGEVRRS